MCARMCRLICTLLFAYCIKQVFLWHGRMNYLRFLSGMNGYNTVKFIYSMNWKYKFWPAGSNIRFVSNTNLSARLISFVNGPGTVAWSEASSLGMQVAPSSIPTSGTFFHGDLVMKTFLRPFSLFRWFKKSSCQLLAKECALSNGKLPRRLAQEQCS